jgi:hypothetical protein
MSVWITSFLSCCFCYSKVYIYEIAHLDLNEMYYQVILTDFVLNYVIYFVIFFRRLPVYEKMTFIHNVCTE